MQALQAILTKPTLVSKKARQDENALAHLGPWGCHLTLFALHAFSQSTLLVKQEGRVYASLAILSSTQSCVCLFASLPELSSTTMNSGAVQRTPASLQMSSGNSDVIERGVLDTATSITQPSDRTVIRPSGKLLLHGLRQNRTFDIRIFRYFGCELLVEIGSIASVGLYRSVFQSSQGLGETYNTRFEAGLVLPLEQLPPINIGEEVVCFDL